MAKTNERLEILLTEYRALKDEEKSIFSFQFTVIGIWIAFLGILVGTVFTQIQSIQDYAYLISQDCPNVIMMDINIKAESRQVIVILLTILIPGVSALFNLIWLDLTTRFIKEAHYIFIVEHKILKDYPDSIGFDHFLFSETKNEKLIKKTNYIYYCIMLGIMILVPVVIGIFYICFQNIINNVLSYCWLVFIAIETFAFYFSYLYVKRILSYIAEKEKLMNEKD